VNEFDGGDGGVGGRAGALALFFFFSM